MACLGHAVLGRVIPKTLRTTNLQSITTKCKQRLSLGRSLGRPCPRRHALGMLSLAGSVPAPCKRRTYTRKRNPNIFMQRGWELSQQWSSGEFRQIKVCNQKGQKGSTVRLGYKASGLSRPQLAIRSIRSMSPIFGNRALKITSILFGCKLWQSGQTVNLRVKRCATGSWTFHPKCISLAAIHPLQVNCKCLRQKGCSGAILNWTDFKAAGLLRLRSNHTCALPLPSLYSFSSSKSLPKRYSAIFDKIGLWRLEKWFRGLPFGSFWVKLDLCRLCLCQIKVEKDMTRYPRPCKERAALSCQIDKMMLLFGESYIISGGQYWFVRCIGFDQCQFENDTAK